MVFWSRNAGVKAQGNDDEEDDEEDDEYVDEEKENYHEHNGAG